MQEPLKISRIQKVLTQDQYDNLPGNVPILIGKTKPDAKGLYWKVWEHAKAGIFKTVGNKNI
jgi:hypothetical protein